MPKQGRFFTYQFIDQNSRVVPAALVQAYIHGTCEPTPMFHDPACKVATTNPLKADIRGDAFCYLDPTVSYDLHLDYLDGTSRKVTKLAVSVAEPIEPIEVIVDPDTVRHFTEPVEQPDPLQTALKRAREAREALEARVTPEPAPVEDAVPDEPPESIADLFVGDRPLGPQAKALHDLWRNLGNQIQRGMASPEETRKHERLSSEIRFITKHAFEAI